MNDYRIILETIIAQFDTSQHEAEVVLNNIATNFAAVKRLSVDSLFADNGFEFRLWFQRKFADAHVYSNGNLERFWERMSELVE